MKSKEFIPLHIVVGYFYLGMNFPVQFDGYTFFSTKEIDDELADWVLAPEFPPVQPAAAEGIPKYPFGNCGIFSEGPGVLYGGWKGAKALLHIYPPGYEGILHYLFFPQIFSYPVASPSTPAPLPTYVGRGESTYSLSLPFSPLAAGDQ